MQYIQNVTYCNVYFILPEIYEYTTALSTIRNRLMKHFPQNKQTEDIVWKRLIIYGSECWTNYGRKVFDCYQLAIQPSSIEVKQPHQNSHVNTAYNDISVRMFVCSTSFDKYNIKIHFKSYY